MERIALSDKLELSRIVYGMWRIGDDADTSPAHVQAKIEACLAQGITTMDQADIYGAATPPPVSNITIRRPATSMLRSKPRYVTWEPITSICSSFTALTR